MTDTQTNPPQLEVAQVWRSTTPGSAEYPRIIEGLNPPGKVAFVQLSMTGTGVASDRIIITTVEWRAWVNQHQAMPIKRSNLTIPIGHEPFDD